MSLAHAFVVQMASSQRRKDSSSKPTSTIGKSCSSLTDPLHILLTCAHPLYPCRQGDGGSRATEIGVCECRLARGDGPGDVFRHALKDELRESSGAMRKV